MTARSTAPVRPIWDLLLNAPTWPAWTPIDELVLARSTGLDPGGRDGVGAVRAFRTGRTVTAERLIEVEDETRLVYEDAFNPFMYDYRASIEIGPASSGGTLIRWSGSYRTRWHLGPLMQPYLRRYMQGMADGLATHAQDLPAG